MSNTNDPLDLSNTNDLFGMPKGHWYSHTHTNGAAVSRNILPLGGVGLAHHFGDGKVSCSFFGERDTGVKPRTPLSRKEFEDLWESLPKPTLPRHP